MRFRPGEWVAPVVLGAVVLSLVSIFLFYLAFSAAVLLWVLDCLREGRIHLEFPPFTFMLALLFGLIVISIIVSTDPVGSARYLKKLIKVFLIFLIYTYVTESQVQKGLRWIFWTLGVSALYGLIQLSWLQEIDLLHRIDGFMSHWMTFSGQLMIGVVALSGYLIYLLRIRRWRHSYPFVSFCIILPVLSTVLILTVTRSAWIGVVGGLMVMLAILKLRWVLLGGMVVLLGFMLLPSRFQERFYSSFDPTDTTTKGRIELLKTGANLIWANPWFGVGPRMVPHRALEYRQEQDLPDHLYQHFHNNLLQISAEMGVPAALTWLALCLWIIKDLLGMRRKGKEVPLLGYLSVNGVCILVAVQLAGLLEYNFGDAEIAILVFFFVTAPYALDRRRRQLDP